MGLVYDLGRGLQAFFHNGFHKTAGCYGEHGGLVVVAVSADGVYVKEFPGFGVNGILFLKEGGEINEDGYGFTGYHPAANAAFQTDLLGCFLPWGEQLAFFAKVNVGCRLFKIGTNEDELVAIVSFQCLSTGGEHGVDASNLVAYFPTGFKDEVGSFEFSFHKKR